MDRYTRIQELSRALSESVGDLAALHTAMETYAIGAETLLQQQGRINTEVQQGLMRTLMVPFSRQAARLQRVVQQTAIENRSEEHTSELQSLMRISYAVFCLKKKNTHHKYEHSHKLSHKKKK